MSDLLFTEIGDAIEPLRADILRGEHVQASLAILGQRKLAEAESRIERAFVEGVGEHVMRVDAGVYFRMMAIHGKECWADDGFRAHMVKANPGMFGIKSRARKTTLRVQGRRQPAAASAGICTAGPARTSVPSVI